ncbi:MAG: hypothetical protein ACTSXW_01115 [Candidatus Baldrarchaeia archaeon]
MENLLLKMVRKKLGFSSHVDFLFERKFYAKDRCAKCGSREIHFKIVFEQWVRGKLVSRVVIPYCKKCGFREISIF